MFNPVHKIINMVCIPKIVPLVYDDVLSYYEMLNKMIGKLNELIDLCNQLGIKVEALEEAVAELQSVISGIDERLESAEGDIDTLEGNVSDLQTAVEGINTAIETINGSIEVINNYITNNDQNIENINSAISDIEDTLNTIDLTQLQQDVTSLDARVSALESAAIGELTPAPVPKNLCIDVTQAGPNDVEIIKDETSHDRDSIKFVDDAADPAKNGFSFDYNTTDFNACHLRFYNVCAREMTESSTAYVPTYTIGWLADNYTNMYGYNQGCPIATIRTLAQLLAGVVLDPDNYLIAYLQLVPNADNDSYYDLLVYPQYEGSYHTYNVIFKELYVFNSSGILTEGMGDPADRWKIQKFKPALQQQVYDIIEKNSADLGTRMTAAEGDIDALESAVGTFTQSDYNTKQAAQDGNISDLQSGLNTANGNISTLQSAVSNINQVRAWDSFSDVFEVNSSLPATAHIHSFKCQVANKIVTMEIMGSGFFGTNYPSWKIGTLRSGVRQYLTPYNDDAVSGYGVSTTGWGNHEYIGVSGSTTPGNEPNIADGRGVATACLTGSKTASPYVPDTYPNSALAAYSLYVATTPPTQTNEGFVVRLTYRAK